MRRFSLAIWLLSFGSVCTRAADVVFLPTLTNVEHVPSADLKLILQDLNKGKSSELEEVAERVRYTFQKYGYFNVQVAEPALTAEDKRREQKIIRVILAVTAGKKYRLRGIGFNGPGVSSATRLRAAFPIHDGEIFNREKIAKGLENLKNAYGTQGYINFTSVPTPRIDEDKKLVYFDIDVDEGKQFSVRRIEFQGNTTTRDKVIRRELVLEEGQVYNEQYWKLSLQRLNQLGFFEQLKPDDPNVTERHLDEKDGLVDLTLKVKERGKNQIGLSGGVSGRPGRRPERGRSV